MKKRVGDKDWRFGGEVEELRVIRPNLGFTVFLHI
jgi:hypothetical protein